MGVKFYPNPNTKKDLNLARARLNLMNMNMKMVSRNQKIVFCLVVIAFLLSEVSTDFVPSSISDMLAIQIQDIQRLIVQEQKRADEEAKALGQASSSVTITQAPDGHTFVTIGAGVNLHVGVNLSGEIIRIYWLRIVDLNAAKKVYDLWKSYFDEALETEALFIFGLFAVWGLKRLLDKRTLPITPSTVIKAVV